MPSEIKLSIVVAVYNVKNEFSYLFQKLQQIMINSNVEILIINDGSTDGIENILNAVNKSSHLKVINRRNEGLSAVRNYGISISNGEYLWFVDGDDIIHPQFIEDILGIINEDYPDYIHFNYKRFKEYKNIQYSQKSINNNFFIENISRQQIFNYLVDPKKIEVENYAWSHIIKKKIYIDNKILFPENRNYEDVATTYKLLNASNTIKITNKVGYFYRDRVGSITNSYDEKDVRDLIRAIKEFSDTSSIKFSKWSRVNFIHRYLVGAYYMSINLKDKNDHKELIHQISHKVLQNNFSKLTFHNKFEYIMFKFRIYSKYIHLKKLVSRI